MTISTVKITQLNGKIKISQLRCLSCGNTGFDKMIKKVPMIQLSTLDVQLKCNHCGQLGDMWIFRDKTPPGTIPVNRERDI